MASTELMIPQSFNIVAVFCGDGARDILEEIKRDARSAVRDISTKEGRANIASLARKIASSKTYLDDAGKKLTEDWKARSKIVDIERKRIRDELDDLKEEIRKPLTDWENKEKNRVQSHEDNLQRMRNLVDFGCANPSIAFIQSRSMTVGTIYTSNKWEEFQERADQVLDIVRETLRDALESAETRERERVELERLRQEEAARKQEERDARIAAEASGRAKREAEEKARKFAELEAHAARQERDRLNREREDAERRAKQAEKEANEQEMRATVAEQAKEKLARDHAKFLQQEKEKREREKKEQEEATQRKENNRKHRATIHKDIEDCLIADSMLTTAQAKKVINSIVNGQILHVKIVY